MNTVLSFLKTNIFFLMLLVSAIASMVIGGSAMAKTSAPALVTEKKPDTKPAAEPDEATPAIPGARPDEEPAGTLERRVELGEVADGMKNMLVKNYPDGNAQIRVLFSTAPSESHDAALFVVQVKDKPTVALLYVFRDKEWQLVQEAFQ